MRKKALKKIRKLMAEVKVVPGVEHYKGLLRKARDTYRNIPHTDKGKI